MASALCLRLLDKQAGRLDLTSSGMDDATLAHMDRLIREPTASFWSPPYRLGQDDHALRRTSPGSMRRRRTS